MSTERRDILFTMAEFADVLSRAARDYPSLITGNLRKAPPVEALPVTDKGASFAFQNKRVAEMLDKPPRENGIVFRTLSAESGQEKAFFIPENILIEIMVEELQRLKVILPRPAEKTALVDGIYIGMRMVLGKSTSRED
jgi:hypothetical protein